MNKSSLVIYLAAFCLFTLLGIYITYPLIFHMTDHITSLGDEYLITFIQNWVIHALVTHPTQLFNVPIFYPFTQTLAFSERFITTSLLAAPILLLTREPVITFNFTLLSSFVLLGFSVFCLGYYLSKDLFISLLMGILVIFSPVVTDKMTHLQVLAVWGVPLAILFFLKFLETKKRRLLLISLAIFVLQTYNSFLPGYFILFSFLIISAFYLRDKKRRRLLWQRQMIIAFLISLLLLLPIVIPYYQVSQRYHFTRDIREAIHLGLQPEDLLVGNSYTNLKPALAQLTLQYDPTPKKEVKVGYVGFLLSLLSVVCIVYVCYQRYRKKKIDRLLLIFLCIGVCGLVLSFGPALHLFRQTIHKPFPIILPYALFYYIIPGFNGLRNAARWEVLFVIGMSLAGGVLLSLLTKHVPRRKKVLLITGLYIIAFLEFHVPDRMVSIQQQKDFPVVYKQVQKLQQDAVIIELPICVWYMPYSGQELTREYYATAHFRKLVNGSSGFSPAPWMDMAIRLMKTFPSDTAIQELKKMGVTYIILHEDEYTRLQRAKFSPGGK